VDGILIIDKPAGITSHDVVNRVRRALGTRRVGHTGTLDPFATGVMVVLVGRATRLAQFLDKDDKEYEATIKFGFETDTGDLTGSPKSKVQSPKSISVAEVDAILPRFIGEIEQIPPMYSAKKVGGKKLYESARKGVEVERQPHSVTISLLELSQDQTTGPNEIAINVVCSAGTYIRVLAEEIGRALGVGAHLSELRRTRSGRFSRSDALTLMSLTALDDPASALLPMTRAVDHLREFHLSEERVERTRSGMSTRTHDRQFVDAESVRMLSPLAELIAIGTFDQADQSVRPKVVLV
jgi:tRNA pseudouridine55 synthase